MATDEVFTLPSDPALLAESLVTLLSLDLTKNLRQFNRNLNAVSLAITKHTNELTRNKLVDKLLQLNGPRLFYKAGEKLERYKLRDQEAAILCKSDMYSLLLKILNNCKEQEDDFDLQIQLVTCGVGQQIGNDITECFNIYKQNKNMDTLVEMGVLLLCVFSRSKRAAKAFSDSMVNAVYFYVDPADNDLFLVVCAMCTIERCRPDMHLHTLLFYNAFFGSLVELVKNAAFDPNQKCHIGSRKSERTGQMYRFRIAGVVTCFQILVRSKDYVCMIHQNLQEKVPEGKWRDIMHDGTSEEQKRTQELLKQLAKHPCSKCKKEFFTQLVLELFLGKEHSGSLATLPATTGTGAGDSEVEKRAGQAKQPPCSYRDECLKFIKQDLKIHQCFTDAEYDRCFCKPCMNHRLDAPMYQRGNPPQPYALPEGWFKLALKLPPRTKALNVFDDWHIGYHGTSFGAVSGILETGDLCMPGDILAGEELRPPPNHYDKGRCPQGHKIDQMFFSPSIRYSGMEAYSPRYEYKTDGQQRWARVAFQVRIKPGSYVVAGETVGANNNRIDPFFTNDQLEWSTNHRGVVILTGLLVKIMNESDAMMASGESRRSSDVTPVSPDPQVRPVKKPGGIKGIFKRKTSMP